MKKLLKKSITLITILTFLTIPLFAGGTTEMDTKAEVTVGSKIDTEGALPWQYDSPCFWKTEVSLS